MFCIYHDVLLSILMAKPFVNGGMVQHSRLVRTDVQLVNLLPGWAHS